MPYSAGCGAALASRSFAPPRCASAGCAYICPGRERLLRTSHRGRTLLYTTIPENIYIYIHETHPPLTGCRHAFAHLMIVSCVLCPILVLITCLSCYVALHLHITIKFCFSVCARACACACACACARARACVCVCVCVCVLDSIIMMPARTIG